MKSFIFSLVVFIILLLGVSYLVKDQGVPVLSMVGQDIAVKFFNEKITLSEQNSLIEIEGEKEDTQELSEEQLQQLEEISSMTKDEIAKQTVLDGIESLKNQINSARSEQVAKVYQERLDQAEVELVNIQSEVEDGVSWYDAAIANEFFSHDVQIAIDIQESFKNPLQTEIFISDNNISLCSDDSWKTGNSFISNLKTCTNFKCQYQHPLFEDQKMIREIKNMNDNCIYTEQMPNNGLMTCTYTELQRLAAAQYYQNIDNGAEIESNVSVTFGFGDSEAESEIIETIDGEIAEVSLNDFLQDGTCVISGYES